MMKSLFASLSVLCLLPACQQAAPELPLITLGNLTPAPPSELERKLAALPQAERVALAKALIATRDWGSWAQHERLRARLRAGGAEDAVAVNRHIVSRLRLPADASPALREVVELQLHCEVWNWASFLDFVSTVTDDYLPQHPDDRRAWQFLSFMQYFSDGEYNYASTICGRIRAKGLDRYTEGQRILHREKPLERLRAE